MNRSPCSYWAILASSPISRCSTWPDRRCLLAPVAQHLAEALGRRDAVAAGPVHRDVAVALEQAHQPADLSSVARCSSVANSVTMPPSASGLSPVRTASARRPRARKNCFGSGSTRAQHAVDLREEVLAQPRHAGELGAVGHLVQRDPQPELAGREREALLEGQDVGPDVVDDVLVVGLLVLEDQHVVLAEHPGRHPAEHRAHLGAGDPAGDRREQAAGMLSSSWSVSGRSSRWNEAMLARTQSARSATRARASPAAGAPAGWRSTSSSACAVSSSKSGASES